MNVLRLYYVYISVVCVSDFTVTKVVNIWKTKSTPWKIRKFRNIKMYSCTFYGILKNFLSCYSTFNIAHKHFADGSIQI